MKLFGMPQTHGLAALAAGALVALAACSPASPGSSASTGPTSTGSPAAATATSQSPSGTEATPGASATVGALVEGFPQSLIPVMSGGSVISSSFAKTGDAATVALVGSIKSPSADVVTFYTRALEAQGFKAVPGEKVEATISKDFLRGEQETVNVAVVETAGVSTFTVGANVNAGSVK